MWHLLTFPCVSGMRTKIALTTLSIQLPWRREASSHARFIIKAVNDVIFVELSCWNVGTLLCTLRFLDFWHKSFKFYYHLLLLTLVFFSPVSELKGHKFFLLPIEEVGSGSKHPQQRNR